MLFGRRITKFMSPRIEQIIGLYSSRSNYLLNASAEDLSGLLKVVVQSDDYWRVSGTRHRVCELVADMSHLQPASFLDSFYSDVPKSSIDSVLVFLMLYPEWVNTDNLRYFGRCLDTRVYEKK